MKSDKMGSSTDPQEADHAAKAGKGKAVFDTRIGESIDLLVEYLVDNGVEGIHPLIMQEVENRLIIKVLERSRGNKVQAAKWLGMNRNTFHRKIQRLVQQRLQDIS